MTVDEKYEALLEYLRKLENVAIGFSGGVDSTFLLKAAKEALGEDGVTAITVVSPYIPKWEVQEAREVASELSVKHLFIECGILDEMKFNPSDRCYICKRAVFTKILEAARENGIEHVVDGTNLDDTKDYRPGMKALKELMVKSPLLENGITKEDIRQMSRNLGLDTWNKPAYACLLSRIPYGEEIKEDTLRRIENSEKYIMSLGFKEIRVRNHGDLARIEVGERDMKGFLDRDVLHKVGNKLREFGYNHVTLDLQGYKMGSFNASILKNQQGKEEQL